MYTNGLQGDSNCIIQHCIAMRVYRPIIGRGQAYMSDQLIIDHSRWKELNIKSMNELEYQTNVTKYKKSSSCLVVSIVMKYESISSWITCNECCWFKHNTAKVILSLSLFPCESFGLADFDLFIAESEISERLSSVKLKDKNKREDNYKREDNSENSSHSEPSKGNRNGDKRTERLVSVTRCSSTFLPLTLSTKRCPRYTYDQNPHTFIHLGCTLHQ